MSEARTPARPGAGIDERRHPVASQQKRIDVDRERPVPPMRELVGPDPLAGHHGKRNLEDAVAQDIDTKIADAVRLRGHAITSRLARRP